MGQALFAEQDFLTGDEPSSEDRMAETQTTACPCAGVAKARRSLQVSGTGTMRPDERARQLDGAGRALPRADD
jgi:hypothetical protein